MRDQARWHRALTRAGLDSNRILVSNPCLAALALRCAVNLRPVFVGAQAASRHMEEGSRIVVIGSVTADRTGFPGSSVYSMTKAAVAVLARGLAIDLAPRGITVNTIQPGPTETDMNPADGPHSASLRLPAAMQQDHRRALSVDRILDTDPVGVGLAAMFRADWFRCGRQHLPAFDCFGTQRRQRKN